MLIDLTGCEIGCHSRIGYEINSPHYHPINMMLRAGELVTLSDHQEKSEGVYRPFDEIGDNIDFADAFHHSVSYVRLVNKSD